MGKIIARKIRGMNLWVKVGLITLSTLLISVFMYQGLYKPNTAQAAAKTYYMSWSPLSTNVTPPNVTTTSSCPSSSDLTVTSLQHALMNSTSYNTACNPSTSRWLIFNMAAGPVARVYADATYSASTTVTGAASGSTVWLRGATAGNATVRLFYALGTTVTYFNGTAATVAITTSTPSAPLAVNLSAQSATVPAGARLGLEFTSNATNMRVGLGSTQQTKIVVDEIADAGDTTQPTISTFTVPTTSTSLTVSGITLTATDNVGVTGYLINESATPPSASSVNLASAPTSYTSATAGSHTLYAWARDAAGNVNNVFTGRTVTITLPDTTQPTISTFTVPTTSTSLTVSGITLTATDNVGVTGYLINESATPPSASSVNLASAPTSYTSATAGSHTLYAWARDAAGNVNSVFTGRTVTITLPDTTAPTITTFTIPATSTSLTITGINFAATDNVGVTGYLVNESATTPAASAINLASAPTSYTASAAGNVTLYAWVRDAAGNITAANAGTVITLPDTTKPTISTFTVPTTSTSLTVSGITLTATDNVGVTGYLINESSTVPAASSVNLATAPTTYTAATSGAHTLYAWARDAAGNVNNVFTGRSVTITLADTTKPTISTFTVPSTSSSLTVSGITLTASDNIGVTGYLINESATPPSAGSISLATAPTTYTAATEGSHTLYAWVKDSAGNVNNVFTGRTVTITLPVDSTKPTVSSFTGPDTATSLTVCGFNTVASDNIGVTGYLMTESSTAPAAGSITSPSALSCYTFPSIGTKSVYTWVRDAAGNVSNVYTPVAVNVTAALGSSSPIMHSGANLGTTYNGGAWGAGKDCSWCHSETTPNIKRIAATVAVPWSGTPRTVVFNKLTSSVSTYLGTMGNDSRSSQNTSTNICEVCHTQTKYHQYSSNSVSAPQTAWNHNNNADCTSCHKHSTGFKGNGHNFPFSGSAHMAAAGTTPWSSCNSCHNTSTAGSYPVPAGTAPNCRACHLNGLLTPVGTSSCYDCHGATATDGWPTAAAYPNNQGSHTIHKNAVSGIDCSYCHNTYGTGSAAHGNSNRLAKSDANMAFNASAGASGVWNNTGSTCATTNCHGSISPAWGNNTANALCTKCHGTPSTSDTNANRAPSVGAHQVHVRGAGTYSYSRELTCWECHNSGSTVNFTNHINGDTQNVVFTNASTAKDNGVSASWTPGAYPNGTCSVYCHGTSMLRGDTSGSQRTPSWTSNIMTGTAANDCALCHGNPPASGTTATVHAGQAATTSCTTCHKHFTSAGSFANETNRRLHIDGLLQVDADCNACHDYDVVGATYSAGVWSGGYWGKNQKSTPDTYGAHAKHINYIKTRLTYTVALNAVSQTYAAASSDNLKVCGACHTQNASDHTVDNSTGRSIYPAGHSYLMGGSGGTSLLFGTSNPAYSTANRTCSNLSCHYFTSPVW